MAEFTRYAGLDVHKENVSIAMAGPVGPVTVIQELPHHLPKLERFFRKALKDGPITACYEAGGCGYGLQRAMTSWGVTCHVVAPSLIPRAAGRRVKTDRLDAIKLMESLRAGVLTPVHVPSEAEERVRGLVRARDAARVSMHRVQQQILKFLLLRGLRHPDGKAWTAEFCAWLNTLNLESLDKRVLDLYVAQRTLLTQTLSDLDKEVEALSTSEKFWARDAVARLRCLHGIDTLSAMVLATEIVDARRFESPRQLMSYVGLVVSEYSSGSSVKRGGITKTGNRRMRRILIEAGWSYRYPPKRTRSARWRGQSAETVAFALRAHVRLHDRFVKLCARKNSTVAVTAVARELVGFVWAMMRNEPDVRRALTPEVRREVLKESPVA